MEIYRDADVGAHTPGGPRHQTLRSRKPLTPHNRQTPMQAFRQSLKTSSNKELYEQTTSASKSAALTLSTDTEQSSSAPTSAQSFRRNLRGRGGSSTLLGGRRLGSPRRGLLSSRNENCRSVHDTFSALGPPQRVVPKTPNSLLRSEIGSDDSMEDESFLVSPPPGALWDRLETSSTGIVVVSPQFATHIHETLSASKLAQDKEYKVHQTKSPFLSPTLQPRKLAISTVKKQSNEKASSMVHPSDSTSAAKSPWFSLQDTESVVVKSSVCETPAVRTNLFKVSPQLPVPDDIQTRSKDADDLRTEEEDQNSPTDRLQASRSIDTSTARANKSGLIDFSHMFSNSDKASSRPPPHLVDRLQHRSIRSPNNCTSEIKPHKGQLRVPPSAEAAKQESSSTKTLIATTDSNDKIVNPAEKVPRVEHRDKETGLMDFTHIFSASKSKRVPPTDLVERLKHSSKRTPRVRSVDIEQVTRNRRNGAEISSSNSKIKSTSINSSSLASREKKAKAQKEKSQTALVEITNTQVHRETHQIELPRHQSTPTPVNWNNLPRSLTRRKEAAEGSGKHTKTGFVSQLEQKDPTGRIPGKYIAMATPKEKTLVGTTPNNIEARPVISSKSFNESEVNDWAEKQSETFVNWINYTISPGESDEEKEVDELGRSPSCAGLRMLLVHRNQSQLRLKASTLFYGDKMSKVKDTIRAEIGKGRLSIRSDRDLYYDLSLRGQVTTLLQSYTTPWLRLGLEVMYGEYIGIGTGAEEPSKAQSSGLRSALGKFIINRILSDSAVLKKYTKGKCKIPSGRFEKQFRAEMRSLVLYRIMQLIFFLDQAKMCNILDKVPRLFVKGSQVKSSQEVLLALCRICLSSEGDFIKHLSRIGLKVTYKQDPVDELDLDVRNLATDLRDGTCLARITEITTEQPAKFLMSKLRLPPISRLQKLHNLNLALTSLRDNGVVVPKDVNAHHIVDGHREMVLKVMWSVIAHSCMGKLLEGDVVEREIENVQRSNCARRKIQGSRSLNQDKKSGQNVCPGDRDPKELLASLLLRWSRAVCSSFGLTLSNFTTSFADGRALCYLIHYYHPTVLRQDEILPTSADNENLSEEEAILNERKNSILASQRASELGGIPGMLPRCDSKSPPDEQSMLLCLTYLCSRLMESSKEILASILIQQCYRAYQKKVLFELKRQAAWTIFRVWQRYRKRYFSSQRRLYSKAVKVVEAFALANWESLLRLKKIRLQKEVQCSAVETIQRVFRGTQARKRYHWLLREQGAAIAIQSCYRGFLGMRRTNRMRLEHNSAVLVQSLWRSFAYQHVYVIKLSAVRTIQRYARGTLARRQMMRKQIAALTLQNAWWNFVQIWRVRWAATTIQSLWRGSLARSELVRRILEDEERNDQAATVIQSAWRGFSDQVEFQTILLDVIAIQSLTRRKIAMDRREGMMNAVVKLQCAARCWFARSLLQVKIRNVEAAIVCQCAIRSWLSVRSLSTARHHHIASTAIQSQWRKYVASVSFCRVRSNVISVQSLFRGLLARREISSMNQSASRIQSAWRNHSWNNRANMSAIAIQRTWRAYSAKAKLSQSLAAIASIQRFWRASVVKAIAEKKQFAATVIQSAWRGYFARRDFVLDILEIIFVQGAVRRFLAKRTANQRRLAVARIQSSVRCFLALNELRRRQRLEFDRMECHQAALLIQSVSRRWLQRRCYRKLRDSTGVLQTWWRSQVSQLRYRNFRSGMVAMQSVVRSVQTRKLIANRHANATIIQSQWRCFLTCVRYKTFVGDIITAQSIVRRFCVVRMQNRQHLGATKIQARVRGIAVRSSFSVYHSAASRIQAVFRGFICRISYSIEIVDIVIIQSLGRRWLTKKMLMKQERAALKIQSIARQRASKRTASSLRGQLKIEESRKCRARQIQSFYRGYIVRKHIHSSRLAAVQIQSAFRRFSATKEFTELRRFVIIVQSLARRAIVFKRVERMTSAVVTIQTCARKLSARRKLLNLQREQSLCYRRDQSSIQIQSAWRVYVARKIVSKQAAARKIQKTWRCFVTHIDFLVQMMSVLSIQAQVRRHLAMKEYEKRYRCVKNIQAFARGLKARQHLRKIHEAATKIQSTYRCYVDRSVFGVQKWAATEVQKMTRGFCVRLNLEIEHYAATEIQRTWRGFEQNVEYTGMLVATLKIQSCTRRYLAKKQFMKLQQIRNQKASLIQRKYREFIMKKGMSRAAGIIQACFRAYLERWKANMIARAIIRLQAAFRARATRQKRSKSIVNIAHRVSSANKRAREDPAQSLGCRTSSALAVLQASTSLAEIMEAVKTLESATRFSVDCCEVFTNANAAKILLDLIRACNRSLPHVELVHWILLILENVGQHNLFLNKFADCKSAEVFLDKVQMFRDKDGIFCLSISLLQRIIAANQGVKEFCGMHEHLKRLKGIYKLSLRRARPAGTVSKRNTKSVQKYERREVFDRSEALKVLGELIDFVEEPRESPSSIMSKNHFF